MNRVEVLRLAIDSIFEEDDDRFQEMREKIKAATHEWNHDLLIETLLDAGECAVLRLQDQAEDSG